MNKKVLQLFYFLNLTAFIYSIETEVKYIDDGSITYDLIKVFAKTATNFHNSVSLKNLKPLDNFQLQDIDENFEFTPSEIQLQNRSKCLLDILYTVENIKSEWGLKMIDSYGKPESGILKGNFWWLGDYNECVGIRVSNPNSTTVGNFRGKYCSLTWSFLKKPLESLNVSLPFTFVSGICVPDSCSAAELQADAVQLLRMAGALPIFEDSMNITMNSTYLKCSPTERHLNAGAKAIIAVISIFCALSVLGSSITIVKYFKKIMQDSKSPAPAIANSINNQFDDDEKNSASHTSEISYNTELRKDDEDTKKFSRLKNLETFLKCFCVFTNGAKLLNTSSSEGELLCIHGIRFLSMTWVILGHTCTAVYQQLRNFSEVMSTVDNFPFQVVIQSFYSVDSFFVLSGFLLTFLSMKEFSKTKGKISWTYFYTHRYLRLTPLYVIVVGFSATVFLYLGSGPYWWDGDYDPNCKKWWRNVLYINNFDVDDGQCMPWSWYLANDMQFYIISPIFLITLWRWPIVGYALLATFLLATCLCNFFITYHFDLGNGYITLLNNGITDLQSTMIDRFADYYNKLYVKPYTRIGPYLIGMLTGFILFKRKAKNTPKHSLVFLTIGWIVASSVTLATIYGLYQAHPGLAARSIYNSVNRVCFGIGLSWVIYVCLIGQGGFINSLLSFKLFIPLSRLTYATYLIHPLVLGVYSGSLRSSLAFSYSTLVIIFLGCTLVAYALSLPVALVLESPIVAMEKLVRKSFTKKSRNDAVK